MKSCDRWACLSLLLGCVACEGDMQWLLLLLLPAGLVRWLWRPRKRVRRAKGAGQDEPVDGTTSTSERFTFVLGRISDYRDQYLAYAIWFEGAQRRLHSSVVQRALAGRPMRRAPPVLGLENSNWLWNRGELAPLVARAIAELKLTDPQPEGDQVTRAEMACEAWCKPEAARMLASVAADSS